MKIVPIFANQFNLFAFCFEGEQMNELRRLLTLWNDTVYLYEFVMNNKIDIPKNTHIETLISQLSDNANEIDDVLNEISNYPDRHLEDFFKPLDNQEYRVVELSKQKGRMNYLRLFAIKIDENCFVITGGAIKFHHLNKHRPHTQKEMIKINTCRDFLKSNGVFDCDFFYECLNEQP